MRRRVGDSPLLHLYFPDPLLFVFSAYAALCLARWWRGRQASQSA